MFLASVSQTQSLGPLDTLKGGGCWEGDDGPRSEQWREKTRGSRHKTDRWTSEGSADLPEVPHPHQLPPYKGHGSPHPHTIWLRPQAQKMQR